jgi:hypothetical protein
VWWRLSPATHGLIAVRALRSLAQALFVVDLPLYLHAAGWGAAPIGALLAVEGLMGAGLMLVVGLLSDRYGRRVFLLAYQAVAFAGMAAVLPVPVAWTVAVVSVALGLGRGANGSAGPFGPAEQAWLARVVPHALRARAFSLNKAAGLRRSDRSTPSPSWPRQGRRSSRATWRPVWASCGRWSPRACSAWPAWPRRPCSRLRRRRRLRGPLDG